MLASYIFEQGHNWNKAFDGNAVIVNEYEKIKIDNDLSIIILSPIKSDLERLRVKWIKELKKKSYSFKLGEGELFDDAYEFYMLRKSETEKTNASKKISLNKGFSIDEIMKIDLDDSETNRSSISVILEYKNKKSLFLGDAHPISVYNSLKKLNQLKNSDLKFSVVKVSHHGSLRNITSELADIVQAENWLISGDGTHGNPNPDTIKIIVKSNPDIHKKIYFNYPVTWIKHFADKALMDKYNYEIIMPEDGTIISLDLSEEE